ncbi:MAG: hypothetical protein R2850_07600 [Bacteroidia bacterium]
MKKEFYFIILFVGLFSGQIISCDICGCSSGSMSGGLFPQIQNNMGGLRYSHLIYKHPTLNPNFNGNSRVIQDTYNDAEGFFRWFPSKRWQMWINVPYSTRIREESLRTTELKGIGDIRFSAFYTVLRRDSSKFRFRHLLLAGGGVSLPTGKYQQRDENLTIMPVGFQIGTGSWSGNARFIYMLRFKKSGIISQAGYKIYSENERQFQKGSMTDAQINYFRNIKIGNKLSIFLHAGYKFEQLQQDIEYQVRKSDSGSSSGWVNFSADIVAGHFLLNIGSDLPAYQDFKGNQPLPSVRNSLSIAYLW